MPNDLSLDLDPALVRPLSQAQNEFVQVLLSTFQLRRRSGGGLELEVEFDFETPAVWLRRGKAHIQGKLDSGRVARYGRELKELFLDQGILEYAHSDPAFPFRWGNGGTLPVIRLGDHDYYCLFYRENHPTGWNIANGGAESASELLDPGATIERELREELIIIEPATGGRYVFNWTEGRRADHPDFAVARRIWQEIFSKRDFLQLNELALPLKWLPGRDSVLIRFNNQAPVEFHDCLVNINAEDFGIEIDRVAKIAIGPEAVLCDGEVVQGQLLNRVVGLFEVEQFNRNMAIGRAEFFPDRVFFSGRDRSGDNLQQVVGEYLESLESRGVWAKYTRPEWEAAEPKFGLCPVTDTLIRRYLGQVYLEPQPDGVPGSTPDVFLSFSSEDLDLARRVFDFLQTSGRRVFFSDETLHHANFADAIDEALTAARALVVVGSRADHFFKPWVRYEWQSFHNDILGGRKPWNTPLVTMTANTDLNTLPRPLAFRQVLACDPALPEPTLKKLVVLLS